MKYQLLEEDIKIYKLLNELGTDFLRLDNNKYLTTYENIEVGDLPNEYKIYKIENDQVTELDRKDFYLINVTSPFILDFSNEYIKVYK